MANSPMLDAIRNKRMGGINLTILVGEAPEDLQDEMEAKEQGLAPDASQISEDSGSLEKPEPMNPLDGTQGDEMEQVLAKGGLGKMGRKPKAMPMGIK